MRCATLPSVNPNWVRMKAGVLLSTTARRKENAASSAVTGLPEWNLTFGRILNVYVLPSAATLQLSASSPKSFSTSFTS